jgi:peroxiredoxin Q/BCP
MYTIGQEIADFTLENHLGEPVRLSQFRGKKVLIWFYPKASTPGCTAEGCSLRDHFAEFTEKNTQILGISMDPVKKQNSFVEKQQFPYPLLSDPERVVITAFGAWGSKKFMGKTFDGILRSSFLIDEEGKLQKEYREVKTKSHGGDVLADL